MVSSTYENKPKGCAVQEQCSRYTSIQVKVAELNTPSSPAKLQTILPLVASSLPTRFLDMRERVGLRADRPSSHRTTRGCSEGAPPVGKDEKRGTARCFRS